LLQNQFFFNVCFEIWLIHGFQELMPRFGKLWCINNKYLHQSFLHLHCWTMCIVDFGVTRFLNSYQRMEKLQAETPINKNEICVTTQGKIHNYIIGYDVTTSFNKFFALTNPQLSFCLFVVNVFFFNF